MNRHTKILLARIDAITREIDNCTELFFQQRPFLEKGGDPVIKEASQEQRDQEKKIKSNVTGNMNKQLKIDDAMPYRNGLGQILPFEHEKGLCDECGRKVDEDQACDFCGYASVI